MVHKPVVRYRIEVLETAQTPGVELVNPTLPLDVELTLEIVPGPGNFALTPDGRVKFTL
jgi:hypothetical protein